MMDSVKYFESFRKIPTSIHGNNGLMAVVNHSRNLIIAFTRALPTSSPARGYLDQLGEDIDMMIRLNRAITQLRAVELPDGSTLDCTDPAKVIQKIEEKWHAGREEGEKTTVEKFENGTFKL